MCRWLGLCFCACIAKTSKPVPLFMSITNSLFYFLKIILLIRTTLNLLKCWSAWQGLAMDISPEDHYMLKLTNVNCLGLQWAELAKKVLIFFFFGWFLLLHVLFLLMMVFIFKYHGQVATDSGALSLDKVFELVVEGENLPVDMNEELRVRDYSFLYY